MLEDMVDIFAKQFKTAYLTTSPSQHLNTSTPQHLTTSPSLCLDALHRILRRYAPRLRHDRRDDNGRDTDEAEREEPPVERRVLGEALQPLHTDGAVCLLLCSCCLATPFWTFY